MALVLASRELNPRARGGDCRVRVGTRHKRWAGIQGLRCRVSRFTFFNRFSIRARSTFFADATSMNWSWRRIIAVSVRVVHIKKSSNQTTHPPGAQQFRVEGLPKLHRVWVQTFWMLMLGPWRGPEGRLPSSQDGSPV